MYGTNTNFAAINSMNIAFTAILGLVFTAVFLWALWRMFKRMGMPGWNALVPFYNAYKLGKGANSNDAVTMTLLVSIIASSALSAAGYLPIGSGALQAIGIVNFIVGLVEIVAMVITLYNLVKAFHHGIGYLVGLAVASFVIGCIIAVAVFHAMFGGILAVAITGLAVGLLIAPFVFVLVMGISNEPYDGPQGRSANKEQMVDNQL